MSDSRLVDTASSRCCVHCGSVHRQVKNGRSRSGIAQFKCQDCGRCYSESYKSSGYSEETRLQAVRFYLDDTNFRRTARHLGVNHQSVVNWVNAYHARLAEQEPTFPHQNPAPSAAQTQMSDETADARAMEVIEGDEIFTFVGAKKRVYLMTQVERSSRCIVAHRVVLSRTDDDLRDMIWQQAPSAKHYFNDAFALYDTIGYPGEHQSLPNKSQTYSVEGDNAEIRHYLARLARKSRCFSRCLEALQRAIDLFVFTWNRRQRWNRQHPRYKRNLQDLVMPV